MEKSRDLRVRSFQFSLETVRFCRAALTQDPVIRRLAFQLVDAGGSVGANIEEAAGGQSKADFIAKNFVALKESREARFWLRLIAASEPALAERARPLIDEASELVAMLVSTLKRARRSPARGEDGIG